MFGIIALVVGVAIFAFVLYGIVQYAITSWTLRKFRGPLALPFVGNCYTPQAVQFLRYLGTLRSRYGKIYKFFNFTKAYLVVCDPVIVRRILSDSKTFYKGSDYSTKFARYFGEGLVTSNNEKHRKDRSLLGRFFIRTSVLKNVNQMNEMTVATIKELLPAVSAGESKLVNMEEFFAVLALRNFMNFCISSNFSKDHQLEKKLCHLISVGSNAVGRIIAFNQPLNRMVPDVKKADDLVAFINRTLLPLTEARRVQVANKTAPDDALTAMIEANLSPKEIEDHMITLVCAGHDTTAFFLSYMVFLLSQNPDKQEVLYQAMIAKLGTHERDVITPDECTEIKYLSYVMMETLRVFAIIPAVTRVAQDEVHFKESGITIPQGTNLLIPMFVINRDPELWDNPMKFIPERFEERGNDFTSARDGFFPFGYGTRTCIGNTFAQIESAIVLCHLMLKYKFVSDPKFRPVIISGISLTTSNGVKILLEPRQK